MKLFLVSLAILFAASMLAYLIIRVMGTREKVLPRGDGTQTVIPPTTPPLGSIDLPWTLWLSTVVILASSVTMQIALNKVRRERIKGFRTALNATLVLSIVFLLVQVPSFIILLGEHATIDVGHAMFGAIFFLILLHALHLVGGIIPLFVIGQNAHAGRYDHEHYAPVKHVTSYWHFLDGVWIVMFGVLLATG